MRQARYHYTTGPEKEPSERGHAESKLTEAQREDHAKSGAQAGPKAESEMKEEDAQDGRSEKGHEEQSERRAQEKLSGRHCSTWSGRKQWKNTEERVSDGDKAKSQQP